VLTLCEQLGAVRRTVHRELSRRLASETKRPFQQLLALRVVACGDVETQAELAERLLIDPPAASRLVARLESEGLMKRGAGSDRRSVKLSVTKKSKTDLQIFEACLREVDLEARAHLSATEHETLGRILLKLSERMR
jgi:DNA-binding MarR family transcriptional regulator